MTNIFNLIRFYIAKTFAMAAYCAIKILTRSGGTSFAGKLALKISPDFLSYCKKYVNYSITVTGTNGKTTTSGMISHILENADKKVIHNTKGANMLTGIANIFALSIEKNYDFAVLESDEAYLTKLYDQYQAETLLVTNLFRDQLDRYGELTTTANLIKNAINKNSELNLILNADDPLVTSLGIGKNSLYFGFEKVEFMTRQSEKQSNAPKENFNCICGSPLEYSNQFFAQEGHYYCKNCNYKRPCPDFSGEVKIFDDYSELSVTYKGKRYEYKVMQTGLYNAYNALGAISIALFLNIDYETIKDAVSSYKSVFGRAERKIINGHNTVIQLIKNPTGASEVLKTVDLNSNILIAINDNYADGRDISWLWDSDFEQLTGAKKLVVTSGIRAKDMALRLKYAGIAQDKIIVEEDIKRAIDIVSNSIDNSDKITILPSYTALLKINKMKF